ncbi:MAG: hypothetical protein VXX85_04450 [Candidatus Margulisiibacteriota bacterium]|nr:hypothetical protein [Candidatus Margulisiibacteriota bacterium]
MNKKLLSLYFLLATTTQNAMTDELMDALENVQDYLYLAGPTIFSVSLLVAGIRFFMASNAQKKAEVMEESKTTVAGGFFIACAVFVVDTVWRWAAG